MTSFSIGSKQVGKNSPCFIIAEAGINHNGSLELAKKLVECAADAGCDAVKFQTFSAAQMYPKNAGTLDWDGQKGKYAYSIYESVERAEMPIEWVPELSNYASSKGVVFFSSVSDEDSADLLQKAGVSVFKTTSYDITNIPLIEHVAKKGKPMIMSTGGATIEEIREGFLAAKRFCSNLSLLHCVIKYPAPSDILNLNVVETLVREFPEAVIGYSDHSVDPVIAPVAAVVKGAKVIEKHITLDKNMSGPDHFFALDPGELKLMVRSIRDAEAKLSKGISVSLDPVVLGLHEKRISDAEIYLRNFAYRTIISSRSIAKGERFSKDNIRVLRPGKLQRGLDPKHFSKLINYCIASKSIVEGTPVTADLVDGFV
jgi:sialic acid synthase SpsE